MEWTVLAFDWDAVTGSWQDQRLARVSDLAWQAEGRPPAFRIFQTSGEGEILIVWYVNDAAAVILDRHGIDWRRFSVGVCETPPSGASLALGQDLV